MTPRILALPMLLLLVTLPGAVWGLEAQETGLHVDVQERVLDNGVTILVWERPSAGRIGARVFYRVDVAAERPGTVGLTHMLEHYLFMGSEKVGTSNWEAERPFAEAVEVLEREITDERNRNRHCFVQREVFAEVEVDCRTPRLDSLEAALEEAFHQQHRFARGTDFDWAYQPAGGTGLTASTGRDWMKFDIDLPATRLELFMWMERSRVEHPVFRYFEPEREVVVDQIRRQDNRPDGPFQRVLRSMTYDAHPYGWAHWFSDLTRATREDHWEIFHRYFIPQNTVIVVVGDVEAEEVFRLAEEYWGSWREGRPSPRLRTVEPEPVGEKRLEVEAAAGPSVVVHVPMPAVGHDDTPVFQLLAQILGGRGGLLQEELMDQRGVATSVGASDWLAKYPSHFTFRADAGSNEQLEAVEEGMDAVLERLAAGELSPERLATAAGRLLMDLGRRLERVGPSAVQVGAMESIYGWEYLNRQPDLWRQVSVADVARVVDRYFHRDMRTVGVLRRSEETLDEAALADDEWEWRHELPSEPHGNRIFAREGPASGRGAVGAFPGGAVDEWATEDPGRGRSTGPRADRMDLKPKDFQSTGPEQRPAGSPLAVAEQPWSAPVWLAERRPSAFEDPVPVADWRDLEFPLEAPALPEAADHRIDLAHGSPLMVVEDDLLPMVQLGALVDARTVDDPPGKEGLADLLSSLLARGGAGELEPAAFEARLDALGVTLSVSVDRNRTWIHMLAPPEAAADAARLLGALVTRPVLPEDLVEGERARAAVAAERVMDNAGTRLAHLFHRTLLGEDHPLGRRATEASVGSIERADVLAFHARHFIPEQVAYTASGRLDRESVAAALNEGAMALVGPHPERRAIEEPVMRDAPPGLVTEEVAARQGHVMLGHVGIEGFPDDHAALEVMNYILAGGAFVSRKMELLRTETGITSAVYGSVEPGRGMALPYVWRFSGNPETLAEGVRLAVGEIQRIREEGVSREEFEGARTSYIQGLIPASYETPQRTAERLAQHALLGRYLYQSPGYLNYYAGDEAQIEALQRLTLEEVNQAARRYLRPADLVVAVVGPLDQISGLEELEAYLERVP